ncbi:MAG: flavodoxin family protein [Flavipsychrobacter sp.]|nr:flavodoxin family protein [Flavipsychrobacter sp.]
MSDLRALIINCTLKKTPELSNTEALANKVITEYHKLDVNTEMIRLADYNIKHGTSSDEGDGDEWPQVLEKIRACDICIIASPIWLGHSPSTVQQIFERMDDVFYNKELKDKETRQFFTYNKVAGALVTGNEDGAHAVVSHVLWSMHEIGFTIPPNANSYWVGMAGGDKNYTDGGGEKHVYTNKNNLYMVHNTVYMARLLKQHPIPTNLHELDIMAKKMSK